MSFSITMVVGSSVFLDFLQQSGALLGQSLTLGSLALLLHNLLLNHYGGRLLRLLGLSSLLLVQQLILGGGPLGHFNGTVGGRGHWSWGLLLVKQLVLGNTSLGGFNRTLRAGGCQRYEGLLLVKQLVLGSLLRSLH